MAEQSDAQVWHRWKQEIEFAQKDKRYTDWLASSDKIVTRYRNERKTAAEQGRRRMNILWSNVETLRPSVFSKLPKPIVERRFMDRDPAARMASTILERCLSVQMEVGYFQPSVEQAVIDYLLPGMGQAWVRYEPVFEPKVEGEENRKIEGEQSPEQLEENGDGVPYEKIAFEKVCVDYVFYKDFLWGVSRFWSEVPWVAKRSWLTRSEIAEKFYEGNLDEAKKINLDYTPDRMKDQMSGDEATAGFFKKAEVWEIWNKADQTAYFIPTGTPDVVLKKEPNPVLKLEGFWPCPEPLFSTQTNETLVPVPDYVEYQDQAMELDDLTARIAALTTALRANGVYNSEFPALQRLLQEGTDNKLIPVDSWAAFAEKGGVEGAISFVPIKEIAEVLIGLYQARTQVKADLFEVTGMSDIVRGQGTGGAKTATEQRIKGQFASMRLEDRRSVVATFCRSIIQIMAEIVSELFTDETLLQMSGVDLMIQDDVRKAVEQVPPPPEPQAQGPDGQPLPPEVLQQQKMMAQQAFQQAQQQVAQQAQQKGMQEFQAAVQILRSDKLRGFRVDIETDSTIAVDAQEDKAAVTELFTSTMQGISAIAPIAAQAPELVKPLGDLLMFAYRRFRVGRSMEASLEEALEKTSERLEQQAQNPQPGPDEIKAQAEQAKQQAETERLQMKAKMEGEQAQADFALEQKRSQMEMAALDAKTKATIAVEEMKIRVKAQEMALKEKELELKEREMALGAALKERETALKVQADDHKHELGLQTMDAKAQAAQQQAKAKPKETA